MKNFSVSLLLRGRLNSGKRGYFPSTSASGKRLPPSYVRVGDRTERISGGVYYLAYRVAGKQQFENVGNAWDAAVAAQANRERALQKGSLSAAQPKPPENAPPVALGDQIRYYLDHLGDRADKTKTAYTHDLGLFLRFCPRKSASDITRQDLLDFKARLQGLGLGPRTVHNRLVNVATFLRSHDVGLLKKGDLPKFESRPVAIFTQREIQRLLEVCDQRECQGRSKTRPHHAALAA